MMLLTKSILKKFEKVWDQSSNKDPIVICKFFDPCSHRTRYATEYNPEDRIFFGYVEGHFPERWTFSLDELEDYRWPLGIWIERDRRFDPCKFSELSLQAYSIEG